MATQSIHATPPGVAGVATLEQLYEYEDTRELVALVNDAAELVHTKGEAAFTEFRVPDSRWRKGETYIFVLDPAGMMYVHTDPAMEGRNQLELRDVGGKPIIRGLIGAVTASPGKQDGWYHYQWPVPGELFPRWKSSYVKLVKAPSGKSYVVGSGMYNDRMERAFVVDAVADAVARIEALGEAAFPLFRDPTGPFIAKDAYIFVDDMNGVELVNPAFPTHEGMNLSDLKDAQGKLIQREFLTLVKTSGHGWVDYMWPKPGESVPTQKSTYVSTADVKGTTYMVGCGVYLADAPKAPRVAGKTTAPELMALVRDAAALLEREGEKAYPEFRKKGSRWFRDETYFFVFAMDGTRTFHAAEPEKEGRNDIALKDAAGKPYIRMMVDAAAGPRGEGWVHYMYPEPGSIFPTWKSAFVKRVRFPSGTEHAVGCGIYNMEMDKAFIEDLVDKAATLVEQRGRDAFGLLRDRTGPFVFMDTYVFVDDPSGVELVNPAIPSLEGRNLSDLKDLSGKLVVKDEVAAAMRDGKAWLECYWYRPGDNLPTKKLTFVQKVQSGKETFVIGSGIYQD
jgi:signal transduction histidine kinase